MLLLLLCAALCVVDSDGREFKLETLMQNVLVLRVPEVHGVEVEVPLTCGHGSKSVFWKRNGEELLPNLEGDTILVLVREMKGGNYTCHASSTGEYLNHTLVLVQLDPDNRTVILEKQPLEEGYIRCSAPNYKGSFHCAWERTHRRLHAAVLAVTAHRHLEAIPCVLDADGSGARCEKTHCAYEEEKHRISLTVYLHSHSRLEAYTKTFYLREIVQPEKLTNLQVTNGQVFSWDSPESWEEPCFFSLQYQVKVVQKEHPCSSQRAIMDNITEKPQFKVHVKSKKYVFCVRAQDKHTMGPWSSWSQCVVNKHNVTC